MSRTYKKRTASTKSKTYKDYIKARIDLENKGYTLKNQLTEKQFNELYSLLKEAKKAGEIKSQPWQELMKREKYLSQRQAEVVAKAATELYGTKYGAIKAKKLTKSEVEELGEYINKTKFSGLYGGSYE